MYSHLRDLYKEGIINENEWQSVEVLNYDNVTLKLFLPLQQDFLNIAQQLFHVNHILYPSEPFSKYCPIFIFEKP